MPRPQAPLQALIFDAYGTLYDVHSVTARAESLYPGQGAALSQQWRSKQLEYTWLRSLMGTYADFNRVTEDALRHTLASRQLPLDPAAIASLMQQYVHLAPHPEVPAALEVLKPGRKLAILSNGAPDTLGALVNNSGLAPAFDAVLSVDPLRLYKPDMRVYALAEQTLGIPRAQTGFVSSNCWDAIGAATYGYTVFWINRTRAPADLHGTAPQYTLNGLDEIAPLLNGTP